MGRIPINHSTLMSSTSSKIQTSIIVLTYNNLKTYTQPCIHSLLETTPADTAEIIVVDNGSSDGTQQWLISLLPTYPQLTVINNKQNLGYAAGNNIGLKTAQGDICILLNNDTLLPQGWLEPLLSPFDTHPNLALLGPVTNRIGSPQQISLPGFDSPQSAFKTATAYMQRHHDTLMYVPKLCFFCVAIHRHCLNTVGFLDEHFQCGNFEDDDYCIRIRKHNMDIAYTDASFVWHYGGATLTQLPPKIQSNTWVKNKQYYTDKHNHKPLLTTYMQTSLQILEEEIKAARNTKDPLTLERCLAHLPYAYDVLTQLTRVETSTSSITGTLLKLAQHIDTTYLGSLFTSIHHTLKKSLSTHK